MAHICNQCGDCCKLFLINLNEEEYNSKKFETILPFSDELEKFAEIKKYGLNLVAQQADGSCFYLKNNQCSIHATRPKVCRGFFCNSKNKKFARMHEVLKKLS